MSNVVPNIEGWKTHLSISVNGVLVPIRDSSMTITAGKTRVHTVQRDNHFWIHLPKEFSVDFVTFSIENDSGTKIGPFLANLLDQNIEDISLGYTVIEGDQWDFDSVGFTSGVITSLSIGDIVAGNAPTISVTMEFLDWNPQPII